ncbi:YbaB/EbfC family nucleoid-associated protein [Amycolatopsis anabasis]|uniref:YbaB/EbfC family nucleoid-associated protein n=1 Tax=Amycolatopsis anabasis TaxID=1840409 RepID=UPI00131B63C0|nr:YbaB/EbfC family nucleoid-associated protein [Amycolatopsis anabasis]
MTSAEQLFSDYEAKLAAARQKADVMRAEMANVQVSERSKDGQIVVEVNHLGNLTGLRIGPNARAKPDLAEEILRTVQLAQSKLATAVQTGVPSIAGTETMGELVHQLRETYPEPEPEGYVEGGGGHGDTTGQTERRFGPEDEDPPAPPPPAPKPRPQRPPTDEGHDDDYFSSGGFVHD